VSHLLHPPSFIDDEIIETFFDAREGLASRPEGRRHRMALHLVAAARDAVRWRALGACLSSAASSSGRYGQAVGEDAKIVRVDRSGLLGRQARLRRAAELGRDEAGAIMERARVEREESTPLSEHLKALIRVHGPVSISTFMSEALTNPVRSQQPKGVPPVGNPLIPIRASEVRRVMALTPCTCIACPPCVSGGRLLYDACEQRRIRDEGGFCDRA